MVAYAFHDGQGARALNDLVHGPGFRAVGCGNQPTVHIKACYFPQSLAGYLVNGDIANIVVFQERIQLPLKTNDAAHREARGEQALHAQWALTKDETLAGLIRMLEIADIVQARVCGVINDKTHGPSLSAGPSVHPRRAIPTAS